MSGSAVILILQSMRRILPVLLVLIGCSNEGGQDPAEISRLDEVAMNEIYLDYRIHAEEGDDNLNIFLQFREEDESGRTLVVGEAGKVKLDEEVLEVDSAFRSGAYYESQKPIASFTGDHVIKLEGPEGVTLEEKFSFYPMLILGGMPDSVSRQEDLLLQLGGLEAEEFVRVVMTDTSFVNEGINRLDTVKNGQLLIRRAEFESLAKGPVHLELYREMERPTRSETNAGGRFSLTYVIKRDFILFD